jgi:predicted ATPase/class 3 adenylate cyclase
MECGHPLASRGATAERRQVTCLFCDWVGSTALSTRIDPEDLLAILEPYQEICTTAVRRFEGNGPRYTGDGVFAVFGYPLAQEAAAQSAVRCALGIVDGMRALCDRLERDRGIRLEIRLSVHTGLAVTGDMGHELERNSVVGAVPNVASHLQALADPDTVVISADTYRLIAGHFDCLELGFRHVKGVAQPMVVYRVLRQRRAGVREPTTPMRGRDIELAGLVDRWQAARAGIGGGILLAGEPGIGKSRLIAALEEEVARSPDAFLIRLSCSSYFRNSAFQPTIDTLEQSILRFEPDQPVERRLEKIEGFLTQYGFDLAEAVPLLANLLSVPLRPPYAVPALPPEQQRQRTIDLLVRTVLRRAELQPTLLIMEDLQWADPSSLDVLTELIDRLAAARLLMVLSFRPEFVPPWGSRPELLSLVLERLDRDASTAIVGQIAGGRRFPAEILAQILAKTDGVPLFVEELTKAVLESGQIREESGRLRPVDQLVTLAIPATLRDSLAARLDRLGEAKGVAQLGATIGRSFSYELLAAVASRLRPIDPASLRGNLDRIVESELLFSDAASADPTYTFKHALIQDAAYDSLLRTTRQDYHGHIAEVLRDQFSAKVETAPELLAHHFTQAGLVAASIPHWLRAGQRARDASANLEAIAHLTRGVGLLAGLPDDSARSRQELDFQLALGPVYMATHGYGAPEVEECYDRARILCQRVDDGPQLPPTLHGLWAYHIVRARHGAALELGRHLLERAAAAENDVLLIQGNMDVGWSHFFRGELTQAGDHLREVIRLYDHDRHRTHAFTFGDNPATSASCCLAEVLWLLGYPDQALQQGRDALELLRTLDHPYSLAFGLDLLAFLHQYVGDAVGTQELAEEAIALSHAQQGFALIEAMATVLRGWALTERGAVEDGTALMREGLEAHRQTGAELVVPYWRCLLAEAHGRLGAEQQGLALLDEAVQVVGRTEERYWEPELYRVRGELLDSLGHRDGPSLTVDESGPQTPEACFQKAIETARLLGERSLELRAAVTLGRHLSRQGRGAEARGALKATYDQFTEGFATTDLGNARALLEELTRVRASA